MKKGRKCCYIFWVYNAWCYGSILWVQLFQAKLSYFEYTREVPSVFPRYGDRIHCSKVGSFLNIRQLT